jgi:uncharacterized protein YyaL (SSP411 family)
MPNRLTDSTSPYLLQHQDNPVDWWEWSDEAFAEARRRNVPIFLSIGYSACHWCHVMAHESFEDPGIAEFLNAHFVSIKVDREERPDIDAIYMEATVALTGHGGWPMSVFLDHAGRPFFAGTYFPPQPRHGMSSFPNLLQTISQTWIERRGDVEAAGERIVSALERRPTPPVGDAPMDDDLLAASVQALAASFDEQYAGFGGAPKFPPSMVLEFLLREVARVGSAEALVMAEGTMEAMARGGMYDQLGGGFARYSVDAQWVVPHFEKMLYDNALLLRVYTHWWQLTGSPFAERIARETAEFLVRDLRTAEGGFASAFDADSEGVEGKFYAWNRDALIDVLGADDGAWAAQLFNVTDTGTFEHGLSTLQLLSDPDDADRWQQVRAKLFAARADRVPPGRDDKIVAAWNGQAIAALAEAAISFDQPQWLAAAEAAAALLVDVHLMADGRLHRTSRDGIAGDNQGVLADYGGVADGFLVLYFATGDAQWLQRAGTLLDFAVAHFDDGHGGFFDTPNDGPTLVRRPRDATDAAEPSGWFAVASALLSYATVQEDAALRERALQALSITTTYGPQAPRAAGWGLAAVSAALDGPAEVTLTGVSPELRRAAIMAPAPGAVVRTVDGDSPGSAMVCRRFVCQLPTQDPRQLRQQLARPGVG